MNPIQSRPATCKTCGTPFESAFASFDLAGSIMTLNQSLCDPCQSAKEAQIRRQSHPDDPSAIRWEDVCPKVYQGFDTERLPEGSRPTAGKVFGWQWSERGIGLVGDSRMGKTFIMFELMRMIFLQGSRPKMTTGTDFAYFCGSPDQAERRTYLESCIKAPVLFIDDLDKMKITDRVESDVYRVIEERRRAMVPVFVTLNARGEELAGMMSGNGGTPIVNRLRHDVCEFFAV